MAEHEQQIPSRVTQKHDTEANWSKLMDDGVAKDAKFVPFQGEFIIYDEDDNYDYKRIKIGNGKDFLKDLPFATMAYEELVNRFSRSELQVSETQPSFACTWFRVTSNT